MSTKCHRAFVVALGLGLFLVTATLAQEAVHWSYTGEAGPEHWGELSADFALCASGKEQSPIAIPAGSPTNAGTKLKIQYKPSGLHLLNNGHTVQQSYDAGSSLTVDGTSYDLVQFHFHTPSEHALDGALADGELHLVHRDATGGLAVVGVRLVKGAENAALAPVLARLPKEANARVDDATVMLDANAMLPAQRAYYRYNGSLTTPPCSESVKWHLLAAPVELSAAQLAALVAVEQRNNRPVQPLNSRTLLADVPAAPSGLPTAGASPVEQGAPVLFGAGLALMALGATGLLRQRPPR